ncbi:hypothetical protein V8G54_001388 [Vigna mungo]|uniref:NPR1/NIM1-like C-terminal domain-containing protein n=1 Tax=Vigna mungo TaxID=3915 RepID=A0AAQ3P7R8_VIGMU
MLHYACAYSDSKVVQEFLGLEYTVLHVAARPKDPSILVALMSKGAYAIDTTPDGQTCKESNKDRPCVDLLEREMRRSFMTLTADDMHMRLDYLEDKGSNLNSAQKDITQADFGLSPARSVGPHMFSLVSDGSSSTLHARVATHIRIEQRNGRISEVYGARQWRSGECVRFLKLKRSSKREGS